MNFNNERIVRLSSHFDHLKKIEILLNCLDIIEAMKDYPDTQNKLQEVFSWMNKIYDSGNLAMNMNLIINENFLTLMKENVELKMEVKTLNTQLEWK